jgi:hypothetical protein
VVTLALGLVPGEGRWPARVALLFALPFAASVAATVLLPREPGRQGASVRIAGTARFLPVVAAAIVLDLAPLVAGTLLGWANVARAASAHPSLRLMLGGLALPLTIAAATLGSEWALRARLWETISRAGRPREAALASCAAGTLLALPAFLPGFAVPSAPFAFAAVLTAALREAAALALFRRGGLFVVGAWRGALVAIEAFAFGDWNFFWSPFARLVSNEAPFYLVRVAGPIAALLLVVATSRPATAKAP